MAGYYFVCLALEAVIVTKVIHTTTSQPSIETNSSQLTDFQLLRCNLLVPCLAVSGQIDGGGH
jgi:hypothetical protein